jgi:O-6-methylguanine DNA methyltransferase
VPNGPAATVACEAAAHCRPRRPFRAIELGTSAALGCHERREPGRIVLAHIASVGYSRIMKIVYHVMSAPAPLGLIFVAATERGLRYTEFMDRRSIKRIIASHAAENPGATWEASLLKLKPVVDQFESYFCGALTRFDIPLDPVGSTFQREAWNALLSIPFGETRTYGEIARAIGQPRAARAVGLANHDNPIAIIVPCHRVIGADGSLTGYGGGLQRKRWLLRHEARFASHPDELPLYSSTAPAAVVTAAAPRSGAKVAAPSATAPRGRAAAATAPRGRAASAAGSAPAKRARGEPPARSSARRASAARNGGRAIGRRHTR